MLLDIGAETLSFRNVPLGTARSRISRGIAQLKQFIIAWHLSPNCRRRLSSRAENHSRLCARDRSRRNTAKVLFLFCRMKIRSLRYALAFALHICAIVLCAGCQSFRWGERTSGDLERIATIKEIYSDTSSWTWQPTAENLEKMPGRPW
jgi:hypothetical protein